MARLVKLISSDSNEYPVDPKIAKMSKTVAVLMEVYSLFHVIHWPDRFPARPYVVPLSYTVKGNDVSTSIYSHKTTLGETGKARGYLEMCLFPKGGTAVVLRYSSKIKTALPCLRNYILQPNQGS